MTTINPAEILKYMSGAESTTGTGVSTSTTGAVGTFINSAWVFASEESTPEQKVQAVQAVQAATDTITGLLKLLGNKADATAQAECDKKEKEVKSTQEKIESSLQKTYSAVQEKIDAVKALAEQVQKNIEQVEEANKEKEEYQKELETNLEKLDDAQKILNNPESTKEEKQQALKLITDVRTVIEGIAGKVSELAKNNEKRVAVIEEISSNQEELSTEQVSLMDEAQVVLENGQQEVAQQTTSNAATVTTATANEATRDAAKTAASTVRTGSKAAAISVVGAVASTAGEVTAMKLDKVSDDYSKAASTRFRSFTNVEQELANTMGLISENYSQYANFSNAIGSISTNFESLSVNFYSVNDALGSWLNNATTIETQAEEIARVEETVAEQIENENPENESQKVEINTEELKKVVA